MENEKRRRVEGAREQTEESGKVGGRERRLEEERGRKERAERWKGGGEWAEGEWQENEEREENGSEEKKEVRMIGRKRKDQTFRGFQQERTRSDLCSSAKSGLKNGDGRHTGSDLLQPHW